MKPSTFIACLVLLCAPILLPQLSAGEIVRIYPAPAGEPLSKRFTLSVNNKDVPVYLARIVALSPEQRQKVRGTVDLSSTSQAAFASFDIAGSVEISVSCHDAVRTVNILPATGIVPKISGNRITFTVSKPQQLTLEINGDWINSLHVFANPFETDIPRPDDPNVIYFGPGVHEIESTQVGSGKTVYIAGGAVVYGKMGASGQGGPIFLLNGSNIVLRGRGIIDGSRIPTWKGNDLGAKGKNIRIEGVVLRDSSTWTFPIVQSEQVDVRNIKIFGWRGNSDGIDICNSRDVQVSDCFFRTFDDLVVIKTIDAHGGPARDITVKHCVLWNEFAHALSIGAELRTPVENVLFSDCDIIRDKGREWDLRIFNCDSAMVRRITFENIRIAESQRLFALWIGHAKWSQQPERGHIDDITFRDISSPAPIHSGPDAELKGFDAQHAINHVLFEHVMVAGQPLQLTDVMQNKFVHDVRVAP